jgi:enterobactin synthetase component D / holo-[acyl-carrier protein] synthase
VVIGTLVPAGVVVADATGPLPGEALLPEEEALVAKAIGKRRSEFTTVRTCARIALAELGVAPGPVLSGPKREPLWPAGIVGSITHCDGYRAVAVARAADVVSLGIDAEPHAALPDGILERVTVPAEREHLRGLPAGVHWDRLLFSAKESVYKTWFPLAGRWLGFEDAALTFAPGPDPRRGEFVARLLVADRPSVAGTVLTTLTGRYAVGGGLLVTAITLPAQPEETA